MIDRKKTNEEEIPENLPEEQDESLESALIRFIRKLFSFLKPSCKFEEFLQKTGEYFDERIIQTERQKELKYAGGKITFNLSGSQVKMNAKLFFFKSGNEKWTVQESRNSVDKSRFNDWDKDEDLLMLSRGETVEMDINHPEE
ncbi:MAG: hypothetical protein IJP86_11630 [Synergistaceae bacterium]|nr:hypothetical protein [Synergistaceae bacterium]